MLLETDLGQGMGFHKRHFGFRGCITEILRVTVPNFEICKSLTW